VSAVERRATRRELVGDALWAGAVFAGPLASQAVADESAPSDAHLLANALEVERVMVLAYERVLASGALTAGVQRAIAPYGEHERAHVAAVASALRGLGAAAPTGPISMKAAGEVLGRHHVSDSLTALHSEHDCLKLLIDLESVSEGVYYAALKDLRRPRLVQLSAHIMACEAQHWTVLSGLRNPGEYVKAIPWPYVYGTK
jgi:hypothetical protein